jgi:hypothetical protein
MEEDQKKSALLQILEEAKRKRAEEGLSAPDQASRDMIQGLEVPQAVRDALSPSTDDIPFDPMGGAGTLKAVGTPVAKAGIQAIEYAIGKQGDKAARALMEAGTSGGAMTGFKVPVITKPASSAINAADKAKELVQETLQAKKVNDLLSAGKLVNGSEGKFVAEKIVDKAGLAKEAAKKAKTQSAKDFWDKVK